MHWWKVGSSKVTYLRPSIFSVNTLTFRVEKLLAKTTQPVPWRKKSRLGKGKGYSYEPFQPPCLCHTLHFKMPGHQPFSVKCMQPWLAWAISCYWNFLFQQSLQKLQSQDKWCTSSLPCHTASVGADHLVTSTVRNRRSFHSSGKEHKVSLLWIISVWEGCESEEVLVKD